MLSNMSMSPTISNNGQAAGPESVDQIFKQRFTEIAYHVLASKFAELEPYVITFKVLDADSDSGKGIGVFILDYEGKTIYIPVVMMDSKLKPLDMFYYKDLNVILPLSIEWLSELGKMSLDEMGTSSTLPKEVPQDVNLRNVVRPPLSASGRYGYASADEKYDFESKWLFKVAQDTSLNIQPAFLSVVRQSPKVVLDGLKLAFTRSPSLLQKLAHYYGKDALQAAMQEGYARATCFSKVAACIPRGGIRVLTKTASEKEIRQAFGQNAGLAFSQIVKMGFAVSDTRSDLKNTTVKLEGPVRLDSPGTQAGWYKLYFLDGESDVYYVVPRPVDSDSTDSLAHKYHYGSGSKHANNDYLVISKSGKPAWVCHDLLGEPVADVSKFGIKSSRVYKLVTSDTEGDTPIANSYGYFINSSPRGIEATVPVKIKRMSVIDGVKKYSTEYEGVTYIQDEDSSRKNIQVTNKGTLIFIPPTAKFVLIRKSDSSSRDYDAEREDRYKKNSIIKDPKLIFTWLKDLVQKSGAIPVNVKSAGLNQWWVCGIGRMYNKAEALEKVAYIYDVSPEEAAEILVDSQKRGSAQYYVIDKNLGGRVKQAFLKIAQPMPEENPMSYESAPGQYPEDPQMMPAVGEETMEYPGYDPSQGGGQAPAPPPAQSPLSPTDLAIGEAIQQLQQQNQMQAQQTQAQMDQMQQQLDMQAQANQQVVSTLQSIQQRAQQIAQATNGQIPAGAEQSPMVAAQALAPWPKEEPPPPPMPMMDQEATSPEMVASQINPEMVDRAAEFQDAQIFDTAAISMLAMAPVLQDIVTTYVPNIEKATDNLGRILLTLWMKEQETKDAIGDEAFISLEDKLRTLFKSLGEVVLTLSHKSMEAQDAVENRRGMQ